MDRRQKYSAPANLVAFPRHPKSEAKSRQFIVIPSRTFATSKHVAGNFLFYAGQRVSSQIHNSFCSWSLLHPPLNFPSHTMSSEPDELEYLSPSFDPASLTVAKLRNILLTHGVNYPSSAKKPQLIELFNNNVVPQAKKLLTARSKTKRSAIGIVDVPSSQASIVDEEEKVLEEPPTEPKQKPKRASRRTTTRQLEPEGDTTLIPSDPPPSRGRSAKHARSPDAEAEERPKATKSRKSTVTPTVKEESPDPVAWHRHDNESPFSNENPFQSGSSPPPPLDRSDKRRKSLGVTEQREKRKSGAARRKTDFVKVEQLDGDIKPPTAATFEMPVSRIAKKKRQPVEEENGELEEAGEEFTPDETLELARTGEESGRAVVPARRKKAKRGTGALKSATTALLIAGLVGFGYIWRQEKLAVGYCGVGRPSESLAGIEIPDWAKVLQPQCEPCPSHAYCYPNLRTVCEPGFVLEQHPLSLGGLVPLPPTCEPDGEKAKRVKVVADRAVEELRQRNAAFECGELADADGKPVPSPEISEEVLKSTLSAKKRKGMTEEEFEALWVPVIGEILSRDEITSGADGYVANFPFPRYFFKTGTELISIGVTATETPAPSEATASLNCPYDARCDEAYASRLDSADKRWSSIDSILRFL